MKLNSRREFFKKSSGVFALGLMGLPLLGSKSKIQLLNNKDIIYRTLGRTGIKIPIVSMGVMNADNPALLKEAYRLGIRHFDTAWYYQNGKNETLVGEVLRDLNVNRSDVTIATKIFLGDDPQHSPKGNDAKNIFLQRFEESLRRLKMDYVDILYYHAVNTVEQVNDPYIKEAFETLKAQKKVRHIGFSTHGYWPDLLIDAADKGYYDVVLLSFNYSLHADKKSMDAMKYSAEKGIGLVAMKTQCQQGWYKSYLPAETQKFYEGKIMHGALLKWVLRHEFITTAVPGFTAFSQLNDDITVAYNLDFTDDEKQFMKDHNVLLGMQSICRFCGKCVSTCPHKANIPGLMRAHMYTQSYGNVNMANTTLKHIEPEQGLDICKSCKACKAVCVNKVTINERIENLKMIYG